MEQFTYEQIADAMETVFTFVTESHDSYTTPKDYGNGEKMSMAEIHTLSLIADNPGISVSEAAKMWNRTLSAASQNINKLEKKSLIEKKKENGNNKQIHLYVTDMGKTLSDQHKAYDKYEFQMTVQKLLQKHTAEDLLTALEVLKTGITVVEEYTDQKKSTD